MTDTVGLAAEPLATIAQRLCAVLADLPAIGKNQQNTAPGQNYSFRGIDDTLIQLNVWMARHGVTIAPLAGELRTEQRTSGKGNPVYCSYVHMTYEFIGMAGDKIVTSFWGEGTDSLDKATSKAAQAAFKYCLFQAFAIATKEAVDADADKDGGEPTLPKWMGPIIKRLNELPADYKGKAVGAILKANKQEPNQDIAWEAMTKQDSWEPWFTNLLDKAEAAIAKAQQDADAEAAATDPPTPEPESQDDTPEPAGEAAADAVTGNGTGAPQGGGDPVIPDPDPEPDPDPVPPEDDRPVADPTPPPSGESTAEQDIKYEEACAYVDTLKGPALQAKLREYDQPVGGSVPELKKRLKEFIREAIYNPGEDDDEPEEDGDEPTTIDYSDDGNEGLEGVAIDPTQVQIVRDELKNLGATGSDVFAEFLATYPTKLSETVDQWDVAAAMRFLAFVEDRTA